MSKYFKSTTSILLVILFLATVVFFILIVALVIWLNSYSAFTHKIPVAMVEISEQKTDELGSYADVKLTQYKTKSAFANIFVPGDIPLLEIENENSYKLYGDIVYVGGPIIEFEEFFTLLNLHSVYKLGLIKAEYSTDLDKEKTRTEETYSTVELNGGIDGWRDIEKALEKNTIGGFFYDTFIEETPPLDPKGLFVLDEPQSRTLCITDQGFQFCEV